MTRGIEHGTHVNPGGIWTCDLQFTTSDFITTEPLINHTRRLKVVLILEDVIKSNLLVLKDVIKSNILMLKDVIKSNISMSSYKWWLV